MEHLQKALALFQERGVERIVHAGDIVSPAALLSLQGLPVHGVYGNNDGERSGLAKISACIGGELADEVLEMEIPAGRVAVYHGTVVAVLNALVRSQTYDLVITGHTHRVTDRWEGKTRVLNPGSAHGFNQGATVMVYDTITAQAEVVSL